MRTSPMGVLSQKGSHVVWAPHKLTLELLKGNRVIVTI